MIYFIAYKNHGIIEIDEINNHQDRLDALKLQGIQGIVLGFIESSTRLSEIRSRFVHLQIPNQLNQFKQHDDLEDYIEDHALTYDTNLQESERYKTSYATIRKQQSLRHALDLHMNLVVHIESFKKNSPYLYFDLHAGPGKSPDGYEGSPLIFTHLANKYSQAHSHFQYYAYLYEADPANYMQLKENLGDVSNIEVGHDHRFELPQRLKQFQGSKTKYRYGVIYADPSNASLPWDILGQMNELFPRVDIMINMACTSHKRTIATADYDTLAELLPKVKKHWIVREPIGKHQWSILVGTNWVDYPSWGKKGFYRWDDGELGSHYFSKMAYTKNQIRDQRQPPLL